MPPDSAPANFASNFDSIQRDLACPACYGVLQLSPDRLTCAQCGRRYPIVEGIPVLVSDATPQGE